MPHECKTYLKKHRTSNKVESAEMMIFLNPGMLMSHPEGVKDDKHTINNNAWQLVAACTLSCHICELYHECGS